MAEDKKINYALLFTIIVTIAGYGVTFGICKNKIDQNADTCQRIEKQTAENIQRVELQHTKDINKLEQKQNDSDALLQSINAQLIELNTKMSMLLKGYKAE